MGLSIHDLAILRDQDVVGGVFSDSLGPKRGLILDALEEKIRSVVDLPEDEGRRRNVMKQIARDWARDKLEEIYQNEQKAIDEGTLDPQDATVQLVRSVVDEENKDAFLSATAFKDGGSENFRKLAEASITGANVIRLGGIAAMLALGVAGAAAIYEGLDHNDGINGHTYDPVEDGNLWDFYVQATSGDGDDKADHHLAHTTGVTDGGTPSEADMLSAVEDVVNQKHEAVAHREALERLAAAAEAGELKTQDDGGVEPMVWRTQGGDETNDGDGHDLVTDDSTAGFEHGGQTVQGDTDIDTDGDIDNVADQASHEPQPHIAQPGDKLTEEQIERFHATGEIKYGETPSHVLTAHGLSNTEIFGEDGKAMSGVWHDLKVHNIAIHTDENGHARAFVMIYDDPDTKEQIFNVINPDPTIDGTPAGARLIAVDLPDGFVPSDHDEITEKILTPIIEVFNSNTISADSDDPDAALNSLIDTASRAVRNEFVTETLIESVENIVPGLVIVKEVAGGDIASIYQSITGKDLPPGGENTGYFEMQEVGNEHALTLDLENGHTLVVRTIDNDDDGIADEISFVTVPSENINDVLGNLFEFPRIIEDTQSLVEFDENGNRIESPGGALAADDFETNVEEQLITHGVAITSVQVENKDGTETTQYTVEVNADSNGIATGEMMGAPHFFQIDSSEVPDTLIGLKELVEQKIASGEIDITQPPPATTSDPASALPEQVPGDGSTDEETEDGSTGEEAGDDSTAGGAVIPTPEPTQQASPTAAPFTPTATATLVPGGTATATTAEPASTPEATTTSVVTDSAIAEPSATIGATASPTPVATATPEATLTSTPDESTAAAASPFPTPTTEQLLTATSTATPAATATIEATDTATAEASATTGAAASPTPGATANFTPDASATSEPPTATPQDEAISTPTTEIATATTETVDSETVEGGNEFRDLLYSEALSDDNFVTTDIPFGELGGNVEIFKNLKEQGLDPFHQHQFIWLLTANGSKWVSNPELNTVEVTIFTEDGGEKEFVVELINSKTNEKYDVNEERTFVNKDGTSPNPEDVIIRITAADKWEPEPTPEPSASPSPTPPPTFNPAPTVEVEPTEEVQMSGEASSEVTSASQNAEEIIRQRNKNIIKVTGIALVAVFGLGLGGYALSRSAKVRNWGRRLSQSLRKERLVPSAASSEPEIVEAEVVVGNTQAESPQEVTIPEEKLPKAELLYFMRRLPELVDLTGDQLSEETRKDVVSGRSSLTFSPRTDDRSEAKWTVESGELTEIINKEKYRQDIEELLGTDATDEQILFDLVRGRLEYTSGDSGYVFRDNRVEKIGDLDQIIVKMSNLVRYGYVALADEIIPDFLDVASEEVDNTSTIAERINTGLQEGKYSWKVEDEVIDGVTSWVVRVELKQEGSVAGTAEIEPILVQELNAEKPQWITPDLSTILTGGKQPDENTILNIYNTESVTHSPAKEEEGIVNKEQMEEETFGKNRTFVQNVRVVKVELDGLESGVAEEKRSEEIIGPENVFKKISSLYAANILGRPLENGSPIEILIGNFKIPEFKDDDLIKSKLKSFKDLLSPIWEDLVRGLMEDFKEDEKKISPVNALSTAQKEIIAKIKNAESSETDALVREINSLFTKLKTKSSKLGLRTKEDTNSVLLYSILLVNYYLTEDGK